MESLSRSKKMILNICSKFLYQIVALISGLIVPRLVIDSFGSSYNGATSSITQFLSLASIFSIGIAGAMRVELYKGFAEKDGEKISKIAKAAENEFKKIGKIMIGIVFLLAIIYPIIVKGEIEIIDAILLVFIVSISAFCEYYFGQTYYLFLEADQKQFIPTLVRTIANLLNVLLTFLLIKLNVGFLLVKFISSIVFILPPIFVNFYAKKKYKIDNNVEIEKGILKQRKASMFHSTANIIHDKTDIVLLTLFTSTATVSVYTVYYSVLLNLKQIMQNFTSGLEASFGNLWANNEIEKLKNHFSIYEFFVYYFSSIVFTCTFVLLLPFVKIYTKGIEDVNYILPFFCALSVITEMIYCFRQPYVTIVQAAGKYKETKMSALIETILNVSISLILVLVLGLEGIIIGTLIANVFRTIYYGIFVSKYLLERNIFVFIKRIIWHLFNSITLIIFYNLFLKNIEIIGWTDWMLHGIIMFAVSVLFVTTTSLIFYFKDLKGIIMFFVNIIKKKGK